MTFNLATIRNVFIDMDGVLYRNQTGLPGAWELVQFLDRHQIGYLMVTNISTLTQRQFADKLASMGVTVPEERIMTSAVATAEYLRTLAPQGATVNVVGESGLIHELEKRGFEMAGRHAEYVVVGWDKTLTFEKLATATLAIRDGATFIGTNPDKTYPMERDIIPGAGANLAALVASTDVEPLVIGKPQTIALEQALALLGARREETAMLGDRLDTDILGGKRVGIRTIMVLTGISSAQEAAAYHSPPDVIYQDLPKLLVAWEQALNGSAPR